MIRARICVRSSSSHARITNTAVRSRSPTSSAAQELIFRGLLIPAFLDEGLGGTASVASSGLLFVGVQALAMPSRRAALFPMVGAAVVGVVHGILFLHVPDVIPLAVAHVAFFSAAMSLARPQAARGTAA